MKFDIINKAKHYNVHPSGIECIEFVRYMDFSCGNAFKYIFRCLEKNKGVEDLKKAVYYLKSVRILEKEEKRIINHDTELFFDLKDKFKIFSKYENNSVVILVLRDIIHYTFDRISNIENSISNVEKLITKIEKEEI